jgi:NAD(P)-dependent dehydrogenase (short-subunit alcohol dehydrogenase family)
VSNILSGTSALVTGGATGIGRAIVGQLADAGARGLSCDLDSHPVELPPGWHAVSADVRLEADIERTFAGAGERFGALDIVVANAGVVPGWRDTESIDLDEWDEVFAANVRGVIATIKHAVPLMKERGGSIIVLGSLNSRRAHPRQCLYTATKHAVLGIVRSTALDLGRFGIRVNAIGPGPIATDALLQRIETRESQGEPARDEVLASYAADTALGRIATVDDVAATALFLAGPAAASVTGQIIPIDGGLP